VFKETNHAASPRGVEGEGAVGDRPVGPAGAQLLSPSARPAPATPEPELSAKAVRRTFSTEFKLGILAEIDEAASLGERGEIMRREGVYSSLISTWKRQRERGELTGKRKARGRKGTDPLERENEVLRKRAEKAESDLLRARKVIEVQGNVSALLGELVEPKSADSETDSKPSSGKGSAS